MPWSFSRCSRYWHCGDFLELVRGRSVEDVVLDGAVVGDVAGRNQQVPGLGPPLVLRQPRFVDCGLVDVAVDPHVLVAFAVDVSRKHVGRTTKVGLAREVQSDEQGAPAKSPRDRLGSAHASQPLALNSPAFAEAVTPAATRPSAHEELEAELLPPASASGLR